jgi:hypothetical protein
MGYHPPSIYAKNKLFHETLILNPQTQLNNVHLRTGFLPLSISQLDRKLNNHLLERQIKTNH